MRHENTLTCTPTPTPTRLTALLSPALPWRPLCGSCAHKTRAINTNNYTGKCNLAFMKWDRRRSWCHTWRSTTYGTVSSFIARVCCSSKRLFTGTENVHAPARYFFFFLFCWRLGWGLWILQKCDWKSQQIENMWSMRFTMRDINSIHPRLQEGPDSVKVGWNST